MALKLPSRSRIWPDAANSITASPAHHAASDRDIIVPLFVSHFTSHRDWEVTDAQIQFCLEKVFLSWRGKAGCQRPLMMAKESLS